MHSNSLWIKKLGRLLGLKPKENTIANNRSVWNRHNWDKHGEEWSNHPGWKESVLEHILHPNLSNNSVVLEVGPGGGR